ncbi:hypothetical protein QFC22_000596 [Naganishia vaughanmartiniae]|uniref:Uncharacterized protein n=1 Tax=Naganishia vaughanmartiniae TaxID=1424756 RepID=A0ACC2XNI1_9TREE|nr:hypothetical protein QFC22_000596 [Naganishia vaughanmartiniae]
MSLPPIKLSAPLKNLLSSSTAPAPSPSREQLEILFDAIRLQAEERHAHSSNDKSERDGETVTREKGGDGIWLIVLTGALFALNALEAIPHLYAYAVRRYASAQKRHTFKDAEGNADGLEKDQEMAVWVAGRMREVGLKSASFMGVPRAINCLAALHEAVKTRTPGVIDKLPNRTRRCASPSAFKHSRRVKSMVLCPSSPPAPVSSAQLREITPTNLKDFQDRGKALWDDIYAPHNEKLLLKLGEYHPDLAIHILTNHYSSLLAPVAQEDLLPTDLDRVEMSVLAVACLRALGWVGKQVESHVFGLRKAHARTGDEEEGWVTSDAGCLWLLGTVDAVVELFRASATQR